MVTKLLFAIYNRAERRIIYVTYSILYFSPDVHHNIGILIFFKKEKFPWKSEKGWTTISEEHCHIQVNITQNLILGF